MSMSGRVEETAFHIAEKYYYSDFCSPFNWGTFKLGTFGLVALLTWGSLQHYCRAFHMEPSY